MENKFAKIPVASHGLHKHTYNYPWLSSINFGDVMPCYINTLRKGERDNPKGGVYSQLMPIAHNAFATGRYHFKAFFVPYKLVWRPWYAFDQQTEYNSEGNRFIPQRFPYVSMGTFSYKILDLYADTQGASATAYDVAYYASGGTLTYYLLSDAGRRICRILGALGCMPTWNAKDTKPLNILPIMCYLKAFADYYWPTNYVGNQFYNYLANFFDRDSIDFNNEVTTLCNALEMASLAFYENSIFDLAFDRPSTPNVNSASPVIGLRDVSNNADQTLVVTNSSSNISTPNATDVNPTNGTPFLGGSKSSSSTVSSPLGVVTQYILDTLQAVSLWAKRHQLAGAKVLDRFLASRGVELPNDSARVCYYLGMRSIEINVSGVENNTDVNLGELAGRGTASTGNEPLSFDCKPDDDGIFLVVVSAVPDCNFPISLDGFAVRKDSYDNYIPEFDKLGPTAIPSRIIQTTMNGRDNDVQAGVNQDAVFGFLNRYWDEVQERPRLLGDFVLQSRGATQLQAYHTFRILPTSTGARSHSFTFQRMSDNDQYQRLFYSSKQENLMLFLRWFGEQYKEKLPLGDSYDWNDDELNRKVSLVIGGSEK